MEEKKTKKQLNKYIVFSSIVFQMGITIAIGTFFGQWLDGKYPNDYSLYTVIFSLLGVFGSLYMVIKKVVSFSEEKRKGKHK
ncbi:MAG: AtpZ/AtpI family protein [Flavobacteriaceae bacterium]|nr:AtpZ/AtpI family protein [Flavobacteriaceae bacterium]